MSEGRGDSRASLISQLSESTVLNQDLGDIGLLENELLSKPILPRTKVARFDLGSPKFPQENGTTLQSGIRIGTKPMPNMAAELRERLIDKPENSAVLINARYQSLGPPSTNGHPQIPRPPSGKREQHPVPAFRTTMFRKDYDRRKQQLKQTAGIELSSPPVLKKIIQKAGPIKREIDLVPDDKPTPDILMEDQVSLVGTESVTISTADKHTRQDSIPISASVTSIEIPSVDKDDMEDIEDDAAGRKYPDEIPIIAKRERTLEIRTPPLSLDKMALKEDGPKRAPSGRALSAKQSVSSARSLSRPDPNIVLTYLRKNKYDDSDKDVKKQKAKKNRKRMLRRIVPENDSVVDKVIELRENLNWETELPRYGPECKKKLLEIMQKKSKDDDKVTKEDDGQFFYCLPRNRRHPRARYDPYDLQIVSADAARAESIYWTVSASFITRCLQGETGQDSSSNTDALLWLWERRLFYMIFKLPVFVKFRQWKTFKQWRRNIRHQKNTGSRSCLYKSLFVANEVLQGCLIHVRCLCQAAKGISGKELDTSSEISLVSLDRSKTLMLQDFKACQRDQGVKALQQLSALRDKVIEIVWESCATVAEMEGVTQGIRGDSHKKVTIIVPKAITEAMKHSKGKTKSDKKDAKKKDKPLYAEIAEWRKILARLSCFLRSVDYLLMDVLRHLVMTAVQQLLEHFVASYNIGDDDEQDSQSDSESARTDMSYRPSYLTTQRQMSSESILTPKTSARPVEVTKSGYIIPQYDFDQPEEKQGPPDIDQVLEELRHKEIVEEIVSPVFHVSLVLNVPKPSTGQSSRRQSSPRHRNRSPQGRQTSSFNRDERAVKKKIVKFPDEEPISESESDYLSGSDEEDQRYSDEEEEDPTRNRFAYTETVEDSTPRQDLSASYVSLSPTEMDFKTSVFELITGFENTIAKVVPMLREPKLAVFYSPPKHDLRLKFDEEEEEERRELQMPWPDIDLLLRDDPQYQKMLAEISSYVHMELDLVKQFSTNYDQFCTMVDQSRSMDVEESMAKRNWSTEEFNHVLAAHSEMVTRMKHMILSRRISMIQVSVTDYFNSCLPYPQKIIDIIHRRLPVTANKRNEDLLSIIKGASSRLDKPPASVEEFVDHLSFLGRMSNELAALEKEFNIVNKLFTIAKDYYVAIEPEDLALYQTLGPSFQHLKSTILYCEAKKDDNIRKFSSDLDSLITNIRSKLMDLKNRVRDPELLHADTMAVTALETIRFLQDEVQNLSGRARSYASYQERFGSSMSQAKNRFLGEEYMLMDKKSDESAQEIQADLSEIERDLTLRRLLWQSLEEWTKLLDEWTGTSFDSIHVESLQKNVNKFTQTVYMLDKGLPHNEVLPRLKEKVMDFKQGMPVITSLRNPSLRARHWEIIEKIINKVIVRDKSFTLGNLLDMNIFKHKEKIQDISTTASNEATLELMLQKIIDLWQNTDFRLLPHAGRDTIIIAGADDIMAQLEESQVTVGTIRGSRYVGPIKAQVEEWERKLQVFSRTLDEWLNCQRNWLYLEQIFSTPDIQRQLPSEFKLFSQVDKAWKDIMRRVEDRPNALKSAIAPGTLETLTSANANLEKIHKCLEDYLETKRLVFPRFYFLSNDELLDILAQSKDPNAVQPHLGKCFGNIKQLDIRQLPRQPPTVKRIISWEGEIIAMPRNVRARGPVEQWLGTVEAGMFETVKKHLKLGLSDWIGIDLQEWVLKHTGQVVLTVTQIMFNKEVSRCFDQGDVKAALVQTRDRMVDFLNKLAGLVLTNLLSFQRNSVEALLTITVHNRDIINNIINSKVVKKDDFEWKRQLRYEWDEQTNNCQVLQSNAAFQYGYEYLGCSSRLVITPLTDRCYLTLTGALHLHLGGSPAGPAGTGKTETVKDLAKAMGKQCVVFNCSEGLDYKMLGKFFSGLSQSGSWCCFDEFNRIDVEVLSVVAQQILTIKSAKDSQSLRFMFEGRDIKLNMTCGYFITMNPTAGGRYAGRVELPDNLKYLFRPVAMMVPDYALIAEIMLFSEGFVEAKSFSQKIVNLYQLASKQLSQQDHYDFGMRAIKSVLVMAGHGRRHAQQRDIGSARRLSAEEESHILIHSLRDANLPKFLAEDVPLFESILDDLFPGITPPQPDHGVLEKAISMAIRDQGLQHWPNQTEKVKQLHSQIMVRHGVMLVGPTGGGKSVVRNILQKALVLLPTISAQQDNNPDSSSKKQNYTHNRAKKGHVDTFTINPKCVKLGELYGETNPVTFEWTDGLIASATRKFAKSVQSMPPGEDGRDSRPETSMTAVSEAPTQTSYRTETSSQAGDADASTVVTEDGDRKDLSDGVVTDWQWLVLDGPVDTLWVENLNTVLDDSKVLCLASGERISLTPGMRILFEVDNLSQASPATISRCAMVYMDPVDLGWKPFVKTWLQRLPRELPESGKSHLQGLFDHSVEKGLSFLRKYKRFQVLATPELSIISCICNILSAYLDFMNKHGGFGNPDKEELRPPSQESRVSSRSSSRGQGSRASRSKRKTKRSVKVKEDVSGTDDGVNNSSKQFYLQKSPGQLFNLLGKLFVFCFTWGVGGTLRRQEDSDEDDTVNRRGSDKVDKDINICNEFDNFMRELFEIEPPLGVRLPAGNRSVFSYFLDMESGNFVAWDALIPSTRSLIEKGAVITIGETMGIQTDHKKSHEPKEAEIVSTVDIVRFSFLTGLLLTNKHPVLLTGDSGVGKSAIIDYMLKRLEKDGGTSFKNGTILGSVFNYSEKNTSLLENISALTKFGDDDDGKSMDALLGTTKPKISTGILSTTVQFSAQTSSARLQAQIMHKLIKKGRESMGAPKGRKVIVFVDDLNMPAPEEYGAQPPLELLRQFLECGGFYDTKKLTWKDILDVTLVAACGPPGGGRNPTSPRLLKHFCILALPTPSTRSLQHIYQVQLGRFLQDGEFMPEVTDCLFPLVSASIAVYYRMCSSMLPTPTKSHYTFNIRDLSKVIQGLLQAHESVIVGKENCAQLLAHEATRVFHDRLVSSDDRLVFFQILSDNMHDYFKVTWTAEKLMTESVLFGDFSDMDDGTIQRVYKPLTDRAKLTRVLEEQYMTLNSGNTKASKLVFFKDAVEHIVRAARVFRQPGGHLLLVGLDGTGKSTIIHLASHIANCELFRLSLHKTYSIPEFRDDLKKVFLKSGVKGINTAFLLTDSDIVKETFLEDINCILNSGEVPDLFDNEELDGINMDLKGAAAEADIPDTRTAVYQFFISRVRRNLHVVLTMSPAGGIFRQRCRMNPALINCCTIDWYDEWSDEAMLSVAQVFFQDTEFIANPKYDLEVLQEQVAQTCVEIHKSIVDKAGQYWREMRRHYYSTPSSYMELIRLYAKMLRDNKREFMNNRDRLQIGLFKLSEANSLVGEMQDELVSLGPKIEEKARDTEVLLKQLEKDQDAVEQVQQIVEEEEGIMKKETQIVQDYADECQLDLASVLPALQAAINSLETLDKASVAEIRVYSSPPQLVETVMNAVCVLFQKKPDWSTAKQMLGDPNFLKKLLQFDKNSLPDKVFTKLRKYSKKPDFNADTIGKVSKACRSICEWVLALEHYNEVYKMVKPKQKRVEEAKEALKLAQDGLAQKQASLKKIEDHLKMIQQQYQDSVNQREALKERKKTTALRLQRASVLVSALADEKVRWADSVEVLDFKLQGLVGDTLLAAAGVAYLGAFTARYRRDLTAVWLNMCGDRDIPISQEFDLVKIMVDANMVLKWHNGGLPRDTHSTENAVFVKKARKWPLLIDPQGQAVNWVREMEGVRLKAMTATDHNLMRTMETALRVGDPVLIRDVGEELDPALRPILLQETLRRGGHLIIKLGDTEIEYNQNFRLYLASSMANPHYLPAVFIQVNIINFTVTFDGLQEQLLSAVVKQERPQLESQRTGLLESISNDKQSLLDLENKSLGLLQKSDGHILDDQVLVETLQKSKGVSQEIYERVGQSVETEKKLNQARKRYLPVATRGAVLYFVLAELATIDVMYQFSLDWFQDMFTACITSNADQSSTSTTSSHYYSGVIRPTSSRSHRQPSPQPASDVLSSMDNPEQLMKHLLSMIDRLTSSIYRVVSVGLFGHHQLTFSFMLASSVMRANSRYEDSVSHLDKINELEWQVFLQGNIMASMLDDKTLAEKDGLSPMERLESEAQAGDPNSDKHKKLPSWAADTTWRQCQHLDATIPAFASLCRSIMSHAQQWNSFMKAEDPYSLMSLPFKEEEGTNKDKTAPKEEVRPGIVFPWEDLTSFQKLILVKVVRPDTLTAAAAKFIQSQLGPTYLSTGAFDLKEIYEDSTAKTPLIFILSPGCDPASQLLRFAKELRGSTLHLDMISLGRGQGPKAEELISKAQILKGRWVFLQNCHLAASWMPRLQALVERFNRPNDDIDPQFRLWLSSKPDPTFPISILQTGMKMTIESPRGLKANMLKSFGSGGTGVVTEQLYEDGSAHPAWHKLLFGLCLFNSVIHERKKYSTLGWNIPYEFNDSDLEVAILKLQMLLEEVDDIPWAALLYLTGEVTFGGRVTDEWDRRCLLSMLKKFYCVDALKEDYSYSANGVYHPVPDNSSVSELHSFVENFPDYDSSEMFGMTENAEKICREHQATDLVSTLVAVQPRIYAGFTGTQKSSDDIVLDIASDIMERLQRSVEDVEEEVMAPSTGSSHKLPKLQLQSLLKEIGDTKAKDRVNMNSLEIATHEVIGNSALITVLRQEIDRFNNLLHVIHTSLAALILAVKGEIIMSDMLEDAYKALLTQTIPQQWKTAAYESRKPLASWVTDLILRVDFFSQWAGTITTSVEKKFKIMTQNRSQAQSETDLGETFPMQPCSFWLSGFFFPQGFLTAVQQNHARKMGISVDSLTFDYRVLSEAVAQEDPSKHHQVLDIKEAAFMGHQPPDDGVLIFGLFLDGARWDSLTQSLQDLHPSQKFCQLPEIHFLPVQLHQTASAAEAAMNSSPKDVVKSYDCPLYRTSTRAGTLSSTGHSTNFVSSIDLPTLQEPDFWVLRGVAMLCQLDD
ncbi:dynein axonemal heavy chain 6-like [Haliotis cracherodii]|uniref:dynein axonemal heavy chain 6-like n=1 Tax=Haliotis cracherodii TaxID=6455 RepID=UPI0039EA892A